MPCPSDRPVSDVLPTPRLDGRHRRPASPPPPTGPLAPPAWAAPRAGPPPACAPRWGSRPARQDAHTGAAAGTGRHQRLAGAAPGDQGACRTPWAAGDRSRRRWRCCPPCSSGTRAWGSCSGSCSAGRPNTSSRGPAPRWCAAPSPRRSPPSSVTAPGGHARGHGGARPGAAAPDRGPLAVVAVLVGVPPPRVGACAPQVSSLVAAVADPSPPVPRAVTSGTTRRARARGTRGEPLAGRTDPRSGPVRAAPRTIGTRRDPEPLPPAAGRPPGGATCDLRGGRRPPRPAAPAPRPTPRRRRPASPRRRRWSGTRPRRSRRCCS